MSGKNLSQKQKLFVKYYLIDLNGTQAALKAGYAEKSAHTTADRYIHGRKGGEHVKKAIDEAMAARAKKVDIDAEYVLKQLGQMQKALISEIINDSGSLKDVSEWPEIWQRMVVSVDVFEEYDGSGKDKVLIGYTKRVKLMDRARIMEMLGKHVNVKAFSEQHDVTVKGSIGQRIMDARKRAKPSS